MDWGHRLNWGRISSGLIFPTISTSNKCKKTINLFCIFIDTDWTGLLLFYQLQLEFFLAPIDQMSFPFQIFVKRFSFQLEMIVIECFLFCVFYVFILCVISHQEKFPPRFPPRNIPTEKIAEHINKFEWFQSNKTTLLTGDFRQYAIKIEELWRSIDAW